MVTAPAGPRGADAAAARTRSRPNTDEAAWAEALALYRPPPSIALDT